MSITNITMQQGPLYKNPLVANGDTGSFFRANGAQHRASSTWKIAKIALAVFTAIAVATAIATAPLSLPPIVFTASLITLVTGITLTAITLMLYRVQINSFDVNHKRKSIPVSPLTEMHVCKNTVESFKWKKTLIRQAQKNIVLSGNFCGGSSFDEVLDLLKEKLEANATIDICILSSTRFWTQSNKDKMEELTRLYSDRFIVIKTDFMWQVNPSFKAVSNHTKGLSIDNGRYYILGGSGIEDKYALDPGTGTQNSIESSSSTSLLNQVLPRGFRDNDFVFKSQDGEGFSTGQQVHQELLRLGKLWEEMNATEKRAEARPQVQKILNKFTASPEMGTVTIPTIDELSTKDCNTAIYASSPEMTESPFRRDMIQAIKESKEEINISHMFFHPSPELLDALVEAAKRGVKINILTNGNETFSPRTHGIFAPRNRYHYSQLLKALPKELQSNVRVYEYGAKYQNTPLNTTFHKKIVIIDNKVFAGSSNMGFKSLRSMSDHEINFVTKSHEAAQKARASFWEDVYLHKKAFHEDGTPILKDDGSAIYVPLSRRIHTPQNLSKSDYVIAKLHFALAPLIG